jgi:hypothetical protein
MTAVEWALRRIFSPYVLARPGQAKNGLMAGMPPTQQTMQAYNDAKAEVPKAITEANALFAKAATLSATLAKYNLKLDVPAPNAVVLRDGRVSEPGMVGSLRVCFDLGFSEPDRPQFVLREKPDLIAAVR